jgi:hypothetical protein
VVSGSIVAGGEGRAVRVRSKQSFFAPGWTKPAETEALQSASLSIAAGELCR